MADKVDYLSSHFCPVKFIAADVGARMQPKLDDSLSQLSVYLQAASAAGKPVAFGEFGLKLAEEAIQPQDYEAFRDALFEQVLSAGQKQGLQGLLAWNALPTMQLRPGHYEINASTLNPFSRTEVDISEADGRRARILQMHPSFNLFRWQSTGDAPVATEAARAIAKAWPAFSAIPGSACTE